MSKENNVMKDIAWLAERLGVSVTTVERMRSREPSQLPAHVTIGRSIRYDEQVVEAWITERTQATSANKEVSHVE